MSQHIHCAVSNCHYWSQGNKCQANEIVVVSDQFGNAQPDSVDATQASTFPAASVQSCMDTCCKTFVEKGSNKTHADSVIKQQNNAGSNNVTGWHNPTH